MIIKKKKGGGGISLYNLQKHNHATSYIAIGFLTPHNWLKRRLVSKTSCCRSSTWSVIYDEGIVHFFSISTLIQQAIDLPSITHYQPSYRSWIRILHSQILLTKCKLMCKTAILLTTIDSGQNYHLCKAGLDINVVIKPLYTKTAVLNLKY